MARRMVSFRFPPELLDSLDVEAERLKLSRTDYVEKILMNRDKLLITVKL